MKIEEEIADVENMKYGYGKGKYETLKRWKADRERLKEKMLKASEDNDWEYAHNDGYGDGFKIISGSEFIKQLFSEEGK